MAALSTIIYTSAAIIGATAATVSAVETRKQGKAAKTARKLSIISQQEARLKAREEQIDIQAQSKAERKRRMRDVARSKTLITDPLGLGGKADVVRKTLTGQ